MITTGSKIRRILGWIFAILAMIVAGWILKSTCNNDNHIRTYSDYIYAPKIEFDIDKIILLPIDIFNYQESNMWDDFLLRAKELIDNDSSKTAIDFLKQMQRQYEDNALFYLVLSTAYSNENNFSSSIEYINKSIEIDDHRDWAFLTRSALFNIIGEMDKAQDDIKIAIYLNRANPYAWIMYGFIALKKRDVNSAKMFSDSALFYNAHPWEYYNLNRIIYIVSKDFKKALAYDDSAASFGQDYRYPAEEYELRARVYASNDKIQEAICLIDSSLNHNPKSSTTWAFKSYLYVLNSFSIQDSLLRYNRDSLRIINRKALFAADSALKYDVNNIDAIYQKGLSSLLNGHFQIAEDQLRVVLKKNPSYPGVKELIELASEYRNIKSTR